MAAVRALTVKGRTGFAPGHASESARFLSWLAGRLLTGPRHAQVAVH
jgi:hypothetical protein